MSPVCFSATASFAVGAPLIPAGLYCLWSSVTRNPRWLPLAAVPIFFGMQQISEGFVWHALDHDPEAQPRAASLFFLFFALAFWPFWFPFLAAVMELSPPRRWIFTGLSVLATGWFWVLYYPLLVGPQSMLTTRIVHHSIQYDYFTNLEIYNYIAPRVMQLLYFCSVALPMALGSRTFGRVPGIILGLSAVVAATVFDYAFVSVWCFFAAILSAYLCYIFYKLPQSGDDPAAV